MVTAQQQPDDIFAEADKAEPIARDLYFGLVAFELWRCILVKGQGKVVFDPQQHKADQMQIAVELSITPLTRNGLADWSLDRNMIARSTDWGITKNSLQALKMDLHNLNDKYAQVKLKATGRKWKDQQGNEHDATAIEFVAIYDNEEQCRAASDAHYQNTDGEESSNGAANAQPAAVQGPDRATALKFVGILWSNSGRDVEKFKIAIERQGLASVISVDDPDVRKLIGAA